MNPTLQQRSGALDLLLGEHDLGVHLVNVGIGLRDRLARLLDLGLGFLERGRHVPRIHHGHDLAGGHHVALVDPKLGDAAGKLGGDIDGIGLDSAVAVGDAGRQRDRAMEPPVRAPAGAQDDDAEQHQEAQPPPPAADGMRRDGWQLHSRGGRCGEVLRADEAVAALRHRGHVDIAGFVHAVVALFRARGLQTLMWCTNGGDARPDFPLR